MKVTSADFNGSAVDLKSCPEATLPEFAFIGRSNVGKSTLINVLSGRKDLARVSDRPGFTQTINFFTVNRRWRLVDLPGYGYAKVAKEKRGDFSRLIEEYLTGREGLVCTFVLIDSSIKPQATDLDFVYWLGSLGRPFVLVFTKADKAKGDAVDQNIESFQKAIADWFEEMPESYRVSSKTKDGIRELHQVIEETTL